MPLTVEFEGIGLARDVEVRWTERGPFLPLAAPMPVGTRLLLQRPGEGRQPVRVLRVQEGADAGVYFAAEEEAASVPDGPGDGPRQPPGAAPASVPETIPDLKVFAGGDALRGDAPDPAVPGAAAAAAGAVDAGAGGDAGDAGEGDAEVGDLPGEDTVIDARVTDRPEGGERSGREGRRRGKRGPRR